MTEKMAGPSFLYYINFSVDLYDFSIKAYPVLLPPFGNLYNICLSRQRTGSKYNFRGFPGSSKRRKQADIKLWRKERKVAIG